MSTPQTTLPYPRRRWQRGFLRALGRAFLPLLTRTHVTGRENFPAHGPLIVVGNHIAMMEVVLMVVNAPWQMELLGADDIHPPPLMNAISQFYGYIPIDRGQVRRSALEQALDVLRQGGIIGIFPEGGIWDPGVKPAKPGIAWLSAHGAAPILPIGFGGLQGALKATLSLKRPPLAMVVGELLPPVELQPGVPRKIAYEQASRRVMDVVEALVPPEFRSTVPDIHDETFDFAIAVHAADGHELPVPDELALTHPAALSKIFYRPAILRIFANDLHLDVAALQSIDEHPPAAQVATASAAILRHIDAENPQFFSYRFGNAEGLAMLQSLRELHALAAWCERSGATLTATPIRSYRSSASAERITETHPGAAHRW